MVVRPLGVGHDRELDAGLAGRVRTRRGRVAYDPAQVVLGAELPGTRCGLSEYFAVRFVAKLHDVDPGRHACSVDALHERVLEAVLVHQAAVADRAVEDLQLRPEGHPRIDVPRAAIAAGVTALGSQVAAPLSFVWIRRDVPGTLGARVPRVNAGKRRSAASVSRHDAGLTPESPEPEWRLLAALAAAYAGRTSEGPRSRLRGPVSCSEYGWRGRIRTFNPLIQSQVPYR